VDETAAASCVPCFDVAVVIDGDGRVSGVSPGSPDAGRVECPPATVGGILWDCEHYFVWLDGDPVVVLTPTPNGLQTFQGWEANDEAAGCPDDGINLPGPNQCTLTLDNTPLGTCIRAVFTGTGHFGGCPTTPPPNPCTQPNPPPSCGGGPPPPVQPPPPPGGTGVPAWTAACTIVGSAGADTLRGTSGRNVICGRGGNDTIHGNGGDRKSVV